MTQRKRPASVPPPSRHVDPRVDEAKAERSGDHEALAAQGTIAHPEAHPEGVVALDVAPETRPALEEALRAAGWSTVGIDELELAPMVLVEATADGARAAVEAVRRKARIDAAVAVLQRGQGDGAREAYDAGALSYLKLPVTASEVVAAAAAAFGKASARRRVMERLDFSAHHASVSRISAALSHELGNPLAVLSMNLDVIARECERLEELEKRLHGIVGQTGAAREDHIRAAAAELTQSPPEELHGSLADARGSLTRLQGLLGQIKELVGQPARTLAPIDLAAAARSVLSEYGPKLGGITVHDAMAPLTAMASIRLLHQVLGRLLENAALAARSLPVARIRVHVYESGEDAIVSIRDNGPGIELEEQERIFEPFYTSRRTQGGVGLGLSLCREYAEQMGGRISLWSVPGRGACFRLHLHRAR